jgi:hypothetical protein
VQDRWRWTRAWPSAQRRSARTAADAVSPGGAAHPRPAAKTTATASQRRWQAVRDDTEQWRWRGVKTVRTPQRRRHAARRHWRSGSGEGGVRRPPAGATAECRPQTPARLPAAGDRRQPASGRAVPGTKPGGVGASGAAGGGAVAPNGRGAAPSGRRGVGGSRSPCANGGGGSPGGPQGRRGLQADLQPAAAQAAAGGPAGPP